MIRKIKKDNRELETIMDIWLQATIKAHPFIEEEYWRKNYIQVKENYLPNSDTYLYIEESKVIGFISIINEEFIGALFVSPEQQRCGVGGKLINFAKQKYSKLTLAVYSENKNAVLFYKKMGFEILQKQLNEDSHVEEFVMYIKNA